MAAILEDILGKELRKDVRGCEYVMTTLTQLSSNLQTVHRTKNVLHVFAAHPTKKRNQSIESGFYQAFVVLYFYQHRNIQMFSNYIVMKNVTNDVCQKGSVCVFS